MAILERLSFRVINDQWDAVMAQEKEWEALESKAGGFPMKRRYRVISGAMSGDTFVFEREWENIAAIEAGYGRLFALPETKQLSDTNQSLKTDHRMEFYSVLSL
jgi:hypothetical protein